MPKTFPSKIHTFLVADAVRAEANGKATILGAMSGGRIIIQGDPKFPIAVPLAFFVAFTDGEGDFAISIRVIDPAGTPMSADLSIGQLKKTPEQSLQLLINFPLIPFITEGRFKVQILLDDHVYEDGFSVAKALVENPKA